MKTAIVFGGTRGIGLEIVKILLADNFYVLAAHRESSQLDDLLSLKNRYQSQIDLQLFEVEKEESYAKIVDHFLSKYAHIKFCINSIGALASSEIGPERRLEDLQEKVLVDTFKVNTLPSLYIAKHIKPLVRASQQPVFCTLSAKVGSITDNKMGGWYSYRVTKAALNMALKNISIEFARLNKNSSVVAIHPGTTETSLSKPFLENASKKYIIHQPKDSAKNIMGILMGPENLNGKFISWDGTQIEW